MLIMNNLFLIKTGLIANYTYLVIASFWFICFLMMLIVLIIDPAGFINSYPPQPLYDKNTFLLYLGSIIIATIITGFSVFLGFKKILVARNPSVINIFYYLFLAFYFVLIVVFIMNFNIHMLDKDY